MIKHSKYHAIDSVIVYGLAALSVVILSNVQKYLDHPHRTKDVSEISFQEKPKKVIFDKNAFKDVKIQGRSYIVYDIIGEEMIAGKNAELVLPLASITKVMTALTARTYYDKKKLIKIEVPDIATGHDLGLQDKQVWALEEIIKYTLVFSSNDGARAIADNLGGRKYFVSQMNAYATILGLDMKFTDPSGLDEDGKIGGLGSALSVAKLFRIAHRDFPELFDATTKKRVTVVSNTGKISGVPNTNQDLGHFSGILMSKTGFTDRAGGNLAIIVDISVGRPVVIVVLGSTRDSRFSDVRKLYDVLKKSITP